MERRLPLLAIEPAHLVVHNGVVALRNHRTRERGRVRHEEVASLALRMGFPEDLAREVGRVEGLKPPFEYGREEPDEADARAFFAAAEQVAGFVEEAVKGAARRRPRKD